MYKVDEETGVKYFDHIEVYKMGRTRPCVNAIKNYMKDYDLSFPYAEENSRVINDRKLLDFAARQSTNSFKKPGDALVTDLDLTTSKFLANLFKRKHMTVFEPIQLNFMIRGISRYCSHELVRHRHGSFLQCSTRRAKNDIVVVPPEMYGDDDEIREYLNDCKERLNKYNKRIKYGMNKDEARFYLPSGLEAPVFFSGNLTMLKEAWDKRTTKQAALEIRTLFGLLGLEILNYFEGDNDGT